MLTSVWYSNISYAQVEINLAKLVAIWSVLVIAIFFLFHSAAIHRNKWNKIRIFTDLILVETVTTCIALLFCGKLRHDNREKIVLQSVLVYGFLGSSVQVIDNYFVYVLYSSTRVLKASFFQIIFIHSWIWITCFTYLPWVTIFPIFFDTNTKLASSWFLISGGYCWSVMYISYNVYFGWKIWRTIRSRYSHFKITSSVEKSRASNIAMVSYRNIFHLILV